MQQKGTAKEFTIAKINRKHDLENKLVEIEVEREIRLANRERALGGSKRERAPQPSGSTEMEKEVEQEEQEMSVAPGDQPLDRPNPTKGNYSKLGYNGPGDLNVEGDWEGPIELFEFEHSDYGWVNCTTGFYHHPALGGGICLYNDEWYRNWEFDCEPPDKEVVPVEPEEVEEEQPKLPLQQPPQQPLQQSPSQQQQESQQHQHPQG